MSEQCERLSKRTSAWPSTLRVNFMPFLPIMQWWWTGGGSIGGDCGDAQWDEIVWNRRVRFIDRPSRLYPFTRAFSAVGLFVTKLCSKLSDKSISDSSSATSEFVCTHTHWPLCEFASICLIVSTIEDAHENSSLLIGFLFSCYCFEIGWRKEVKFEQCSNIFRITLYLKQFQTLTFLKPQTCVS